MVSFLSQPLTLYTSLSGLSALSMMEYRVLRLFVLSGPCTLAVTTLASIPMGWVPEEVGPRYFDPHGYSTWFSIHDSAEAILDRCLTQQKAGMSWSLRKCIPFFCSALENEN